MLYYPPEVSSMRYCYSWEYLGRNTSGSSLNSIKRKSALKCWYSRVVKVRNTSEAYSYHNTLLGNHTDHSPMDLGQYNSLGEYCGLNTASSVFLIIITRVIPFIQSKCPDIEEIIFERRVRETNPEMYKC